MHNHYCIFLVPPSKLNKTGKYNVSCLKEKKMTVTSDVEELIQKMLLEFPRKYQFIYQLT